MTKVIDIHKALSELDPSSWNTFMSEIQVAFRSVTGKPVTITILDEVFWKVLGKRKRVTRAGAALKKIGRVGPKYTCPWDGKDVTASVKTIRKPTIRDPNEHCELAIQLDCGHWLLSNCDRKSGLNEVVLNVKDKRQIPGMIAGGKPLIKESNDG